jgi:hypothetical protein
MHSLESMILQCVVFAILLIVWVSGLVVYMAIKELIDRLNKSR